MEVFKELDERIDKKLLIFERDLKIKGKKIAVLMK